MSQITTPRFVAAAAKLEKPGCAVYACFQNLDAVAEVAGPSAAEDLRNAARRELGHIGDLEEIEGDFITVVAGELGDVLERLRSVSWLVHVFIGVTEVWRLRAADEWLEELVPRRLMELSAGLRFGVAPIGADPAAALATAAKSAAEQRVDKRGVTRFGFPPLWPKRFRTLTQIADPQCPACAMSRPDVIERNESFTREHCSACDLVYERHRVWMVGGRDVGSCAHLSEDS